MIMKMNESLRKLPLMYNDELKCYIRTRHVPAFGYLPSLFMLEKMDYRVPRALNDSVPKMWHRVPTILCIAVGLFPISDVRGATI
jgi:hypothetical protein